MQRKVRPHGLPTHSGYRWYLHGIPFNGGWQCHGHSSLMMLDLINAALATWMPLGIYQESGKRSAQRGIGNAAIGNCKRSEKEEEEQKKRKKKKEQRCHSHLLMMMMMIIYGAKGLRIRAFEPYFLFGRVQIFALASQAETHTLAHSQTGIRKNNKLFTIFIVCDCDC